MEHRHQWKESMEISPQPMYFEGRCDPNRTLQGFNHSWSGVGYIREPPSDFPTVSSPPTRRMVHGRYNFA
jgi:hypothetical protein